MTYDRNWLSQRLIEDCLNIKTTSLSPHIHKILSEGKCNISH
ncbi:unnamed protein product [Oncorhynchus mykiss]|uniref:Uncharacterized protein n=1 Tax=Oncorhynchus mykiss TaxID=8022 RepID=A0A060XV35_ONCMY|nr:unnamed protein product [Oncorhynchus mykiss]